MFESFVLPETVSESDGPMISVMDNLNLLYFFYFVEILGSLIVYSGHTSSCICSCTFYRSIKQDDNIIYQRNYLYSTNYILRYDTNFQNHERKPVWEWVIGNTVACAYNKTTLLVEKS